MGDGRNTNVWHDKWIDKGPLSDFISFKDRYEARYSEKLTVVECIVNGEWLWTRMVVEV